VSALAFYEARLAVERQKPQLRRAARDISAALVVVLALLTAFALANTAAVRALSTRLSDWVAPLVLAAGWAVVGALLALFLRARAKRARVWKRRMRRPRERKLERFAPAITKEVALAAVPMAGDMASGVVDAGAEIIDNVDEMVDAIVEDIPGGGVVNQIWDVVLVPGRLGIRVATTVLRRGDSSS
jgi:uncharacterized integral membrane protein